MPAAGTLKSNRTVFEVFEGPPSFRTSLSGVVATWTPLMVLYENAPVSWLGVMGVRPATETRSENSDVLPTGSMASSVNGRVPVIRLSAKENDPPASVSWVPISWRPSPCESVPLSAT